MNGISQMTVTDNVSLLYFDRMAADGSTMTALLCALAEEGVNLDMISQSAPYAHNVSLAFTIPDEDLVRTLKICNDLSKQHGGLKPMVSSSNCKLQLYGEEMRETPGVAARTFEAIYASGAEIQLITTSEVDISCLVSGVDVDGAIGCLKQAFKL